MWQPYIEQMIGIWATQKMADSEREEAKNLVSRIVFTNFSVFFNDCIPCVPIEIFVIYVIVHDKYQNVYTVFVGFAWWSVIIYSSEKKIVRSIQDKKKKIVSYLHSSHCDTVCTHRVCEWRSDETYVRYALPVSCVCAACRCVRASERAEQ